MDKHIPLHDDLARNYDGFAHLLYVDESKHPAEAANIGKTCTFKNPRWPAERGFHTIGSLQFDYQGQLCYRVYSQEFNDTFGRPLSIDEANIIETMEKQND
jgi:hypothetical protein